MLNIFISYVNRVMIELLLFDCPAKNIVVTIIITVKASISKGECEKPASLLD